MAKKKTDTSHAPSHKPTPHKTTAPKSAAKKAPAKKAKKPAVPAGGNLIVDTSRAAEAAARMLAARAKLGTAAEPASAEKESSAFKQLKEGLNKPHAQTAAAALGNSLGPAKQNLPQHTGQQQVAHNQTYGGASRVNVPRRTAG